ncbi:MAG: hypothetical protein J5965_26055 [Aeriscardovia sp.]|nr:hypothetical protein [Aeriscardovia sp.]
MDYDNGFILQKAIVSTNRSVDWSLLRSSSARLLPSGRKNYHRIIHKNNPRFNRMNQRSTAEGKVKFQFEFENGEVLRLKLYEHLKGW